MLPGIYSLSGPCTLHQAGQALSICWGSNAFARALYYETIMRQSTCLGSPAQPYLLNGQCTLHQAGQALTICWGSDAFARAFYHETIMRQSTCLGSPAWPLAMPGQGGHPHGLWILVRVSMVVAAQSHASTHASLLAMLACHCGVLL